MVIAAQWSDRALCAEIADDKETLEEKNQFLSLFFANDDDTPAETKQKYEQAKAVCMQCPVRKKCLEDALAREDRFGVWGGADESQIRKALRIDQFGHPTVRLRQMKCPMCSGKDLTFGPETRTKTKIKCNAYACGLVWWARRKLPVTPVDAEMEQETSEQDVE